PSTPDIYTLSLHDALPILHNSGTRQGNARVFDYYHKHVRRMQNGLAYHFVIGNGTSTGNGQIEVGDRWRRQINGGHVHSDYLNKDRKSTRLNSSHRTISYA